MSWSEALERTVTGLHYDLVDVERSAGGLLRVTIDRLPGESYPTGPGEFVLVEDCEIVTRQLQYLLEVEGVDYARLEVSSPGFDRVLRKPAHFERFVGHLSERTAIIVDPMLATAGSMIATVDLLKARGCTDIRALVLVAAPEGIRALEAAHPDVRCWTAAIDSHLNELGYIIPGLGDAGDKIFGTKDDETV